MIPALKRLIEIGDYLVFNWASEYEHKEWEKLKKEIYEHMENRKSD